MNVRRLSAAALVIVTGAAGVSSAQVSYRGAGSRRDTAVVVDARGQSRELRVGDTLPEVGEVKQIADDEIVFERDLDEEERAELEQNGLPAPDVRRLHVPKRFEAVADDGAHGTLVIGGD